MSVNYRRIMWKKKEIKYDRCLRNNGGKPMTICIAAICSNSKKLVMASDRMITAEDLLVEFEHPTPKLEKLVENCAVATAGDALKYTELFNRVFEDIEDLRNPIISKIADCIKEKYQIVRREEVVDRILFPNGLNNIDDFFKRHKKLNSDICMSIQRSIEEFDYDLEILIGGVDPTGAHIYEVDNPGVTMPFDSIGYRAIGTGYPHAETIFISHDYSAYTQLKRALFIVYEAKKISEKAPGVGNRFTDLCIIDEHGVKILPQDFVDQLDEIYKNNIASRTSLRDIDKAMEDLEVK